MFLQWNFLLCLCVSYWNRYTLPSKKHTHSMCRKKYTMDFPANKFVSQCICALRRLFYMYSLVNSLQFPSKVKKQLNISQNRQKTARTNNLVCSRSCLPPVLDILSSSFPSPPPPHSNPLPAHRSWRKHFPDQKDSWRKVKDRSSFFFLFVWGGSVKGFLYIVEYQSVCPVVWIGSPHPLPRKRVWLKTQEGEPHSLAG